MKALIIDDENKARALLQTIIQENCPEFDSILQAGNLIEGVELIKSEQPDIVFLDIEMPEHSGLEILDFFDNSSVNFQIIFVTAYNQYAIEAFKMSATDYLLKPVDVDELKEAVSKAREQKTKGDITISIERLKTSFNQLAKRKIALEVPRGIIFVNHDDVLYLEADGMYTHVYLKNLKKECIAKPLKYFAEQLEDHAQFYRPHRSFIVNVGMIKEFNKKDGGYLIMEDLKKIAISRDKKEAFFTAMQHMLH